MNTLEINNIFKRLAPQTFLGTFSLNHLPNFSPARNRQAGFIINTDDCQKPGQHWVAIYIYFKNGNWFGEYFDSLGQLPLPSISQWLNKSCTPSRWIYNSVPLQHPLSLVCGCYCVYFLYQRLLFQTPFSEIIQLLQVQRDRDTFVFKICKQLSVKHSKL